MMKSKIFLAFLLFTPPLVLLVSTLSFQSGYSPNNTKNNGIFFSEYFDVKDLNLINDEKVIAFDDGKWTFATYAYKSNSLEEALYLMRQLNIALNRDINKLKRVIFTSDENTLVGLLSDYPRVEIVIDSDSKLLKKLLQAGNEGFFQVQADPEERVRTHCDV